MKTSTRLFLWATLVLVFPTVFAADYERFVGEYEGKYYSPDGDQTRNRDLGVKISKVDDGFNLKWITTTFKKGKPKHKTYSIDFLETDRDNIYKAAQKKNVFGGREPLDPLKGEPFAWARIIDTTLSVFVLLITDEGGWEMQTFDRVLTTEGNLDVRFSRVLDGEKSTTITVSLERTK